MTATAWRGYLGESLAEHGIAAPGALSAAVALGPWAVEFRYDESLGEVLDRRQALAWLHELRLWAETELEG